jgi:hypothetical protein
MPMTKSHALTVAVALLAAVPAFADKVESGPEAGAAVPALKVYDVTGPHADKELDYVADRKDRPTVYLFVVADKWDRPVARFLKKFDGELPKQADARAVAVWLTDDPDATKRYLPLAQQSLQLKETALTCYPVAKKTPDGWGLNLEAGLTAVVVNKRKVAASFGLRSATEADVAGVIKALEKARSGK